MSVLSLSAHISCFNDGIYGVVSQVPVRCFLDHLLVCSFCIAIVRCSVSRRHRACWFHVPQICESGQYEGLRRATATVKGCEGPDDDTELRVERKGERAMQDETRCRRATEFAQAQSHTLKNAWLLED